MDKNTENQSQERLESGSAMPRPCPQECIKCSPWQQLFCCTKMLFELSKTVNGLSGTITEAKTKIEKLSSEVSELKSIVPPQTDELSNPATER